MPNQPQAQAKVKRSKEGEHKSQTPRLLRRLLISAGCLTCRQTHTKCDENRPSCSRCVRLQFKCVGIGYAYDPKELARATEAQRRLLHDRIIASPIHRQLIPSDGSVYLHHFATFCAKGLFYVDDKAENPFCREIYHNLDGCEHLQLAVNALSAGDLQRRQAGHKANYFDFYGRAVGKLNEALSRRETAASTATLISVLLLAFCDVSAAEPASSIRLINSDQISSSHGSAWISHLKGARDLHVLRGGPKKDPVLARVFSLVDIGSSFFLGRETLLPSDYFNDDYSVDVQAPQGESWPVWDLTGWVVDRFNERLRIVARLSRLALDAKKCLQTGGQRKAFLSQSQRILQDISNHWSAPPFEMEVGSLLKIAKDQREQLVLEDSAARSACVLALIDTTAPILNLEPDLDFTPDVTCSPAIVSYHIDSIIAACAAVDEPYCLAGFPWPLFMAGTQLFRDEDRERAVIEAMRRITPLVFYVRKSALSMPYYADCSWTQPFEGAIRLLETLWQRQWEGGVKLSWRQVLEDSGGAM